MTVVLDASAVIAQALGEPGADIVARMRPNAVMSAVNAAEVVGRLARDFLPEHIRASIDGILPTTLAVDRELAIEVGLLLPITKSAGLSLGDRFCLALARQLSCPVLTADREWLKIANAVGVEVRVIR